VAGSLSIIPIPDDKKAGKVADPKRVKLPTAKSSMRADLPSASLTIATTIAFALFAQLFFVEAGGAQLLAKRGARLPGLADTHAAWPDLD
jgi:hypothetical protein